MSIWNHTGWCLFFLILADVLFWLLVSSLLYYFVFIDSLIFFWFFEKGGLKTKNGYFLSLTPLIGMLFLIFLFHVFPYSFNYEVIL